MAKQSKKLKCIIVYSSQKHVPYINDILSIIKNCVKSQGFEPVLLEEIIKSGKDYLSTIRECIDDSVLGIVVLDGFRPNVLFEFGTLCGTDKCFILLQSDAAKISVRTLYRDAQESGLDDSIFKNLKDPPIEIARHFSDFGGKHIIFFDWTKTSELEEELANILRGIIDTIETKLKNTLDDLKSNRSNENLLEKYFHLGRLYEKKENFQKAIEIFKAITEYDPSYELAWASLGDNLLRLSIYNDAESAFRNALKCKPDSWGSWWKLGNSLEGQYNDDEAEHCYKKAIELNPNSFEVWLSLGTIYHSRKEYTKAESHYKKAQELCGPDSPAYTTILNVRGMNYESQKKYTKAREYYQSAIDLDQNSASSWAWLGRTYYLQRKYTEAQRYLEKAIQLDSKFVPAWFILGEVHQSNGDYKEAETCYKTATNLDENYVESWFKLGTLYYKQELYNKAEGFFLKASGLGLDSSEFWSAFGDNYYYQENYDEAEHSYKKAIELDPDKLWLWVSLKSVYNETHNKTESEHCQKTIEELRNKKTKPELKEEE